MNAKVLCYITSLSILSICAVEIIEKLDGLETKYKSKKLENVIVKPDLTLAAFNGWTIVIAVSTKLRTFLRLPEWRLHKNL
jgi:hypothetical protein